MTFLFTLAVTNSHNFPINTCNLWMSTSIHLNAPKNMPLEFLHFPSQNMAGFRLFSLLPSLVG